MLQRQQSGTWDIASAAIDARAAKQSRCDANAANQSGMLAMQQSYDTYAAIWMHAVIAAIHLTIC